MRELKFIVRGQSLRKDPYCDFTHLIAGSVGHLRASFQFSDEWNGCTKVARFWYDNSEHAVLIDDKNSCDIPSEVLNGESFSLSLIGAKDGYHIPTNETRVRQEVVR